jgi:hypothetical protein
MTVRTANTPASIDADTVLYRSVRDKGYVQMTTNLGDLNFEVRGFFPLCVSVCLCCTGSFLCRPSSYQLASTPAVVL